MNQPESGDGAAPLLSLRDVSQVFKTKGGDVPAVRSVSLDVNAGEVLCLVGESGCGKTTTARMAAGLAHPTSGVADFEGVDITAMNKKQRSRFRKEVQFIHQDPYASLNPIRTVFGTMAAPLRRHGLASSKSQAWDKAVELLERVDLTPAQNFLPKFPHQLSGGQRQRVAMARALALGPRLIVADEATSMLDVSIRVGILRTLTKLRQDLNVGFVFITHDLAIARYFGAGGQIAVMYLGRVVEHGPTSEVIENPRHPYTRALLAAVPDIALEHQGRQEPGLRGVDIPSLTALPSGCTFHPRCPMYRPGDCDSVEPQLSTVDPKRDVACHVVAEEVAGQKQGT